MFIDELDEVIKVWKTRVLVGGMGDYELQIEEGTPDDLAAMTLFLDYNLVKNAGESQEVYEGYQKAAQDMINFLGIRMYQDASTKTIRIMKSDEFQKTQKMLADFINSPNS